MKNEISHPAHYVNQAVPLEPLDVISDAPFAIGCCIKYLVRAGHKPGNSKSDDLDKARVYFRVAQRRYRRKPAAYDEWWSHYGELVCKFKVFSDKRFDEAFFAMFLRVLEEKLF